MSRLETGYDVQWHRGYWQGYDLYVLDVDVGEIYLPTSLSPDDVIRFSRMEGKGDIKRPFEISQLIGLIEKGLGKAGITEKDEQKDEQIFSGVELSDTERRLLEVLLENRGRAVSVEELSEKVWGRQSVRSNVVNVYISYLRQKLEKNTSRRIIFTVRGKGYKID